MPFVSFFVVLHPVRLIKLSLTWPANLANMYTVLSKVFSNLLVNHTAGVLCIFQIDHF